MSGPTEEKLSNATNPMKRNTQGTRRTMDGKRRMAAATAMRELARKKTFATETSCSRVTSLQWSKRRSAA